MKIERVAKDFVKLFMLKNKKLYSQTPAKFYVEEKNSAKFYVIWRSGGGFFSILSTILLHLKIAEQSGKKPIVDLKNFSSTYKESNPINGSENVWEYYFEPIGVVGSMNEYANSNFQITDGSHPVGMPMSISNSPDLYQIWKKYIHIKNHVEEMIKYDERRLEISKSTLGIHFRGMEMRTATGHPLPPSFKQMFFEVDNLIDVENYKNLYLLTENQRYLKKFHSRYGSRLVFSDSYRTSYRNSHSIYPRQNHKYLLGLEILRDTILLSKCGGIVSGSSNVSETAILLNQAKYRHNIQIRNGSNSHNAFLAIFKWYLKIGLLSPKNFRT